ncbi:MAG: site-specific integrase [Planctomycetes bacterium]|nr:site-specific integrase [Planctomycetota bacterium]
MPRLVNRAPSYRRHATGQAFVKISGRSIYLGKYGTKESRAEYRRIIAEWEANHRQPVVPATDLTVMELCAAYWRFAKRFYIKNGRQTDECACIKAALKHLKRLYGPTPAIQFGPKALKTVRQAMVDAGNSRGYINKNVSRIRRMFRWAAAEEMLPPSIHQALAAVDGLKEGKTEAHDTAPIQPVADATVDATLKHMHPTPADMVRLQRLTGMRPGEVCILRPCDVDRSGDVWAYRPESHKTEHQGRERVIFIGPKAQAILAPHLLKTEPERYCFRPYRSARSKRYSVDGYRSAIWYACERAFPPPPPLALLPDETHEERQKRLAPKQQEELRAWNNSVHWSPNRLRHTAGTLVRKQFGLEAAQVALGHSKADVTQVYAARDHDLAARVAREVG